MTIDRMKEKCLIGVTMQFFKEGQPILFSEFKDWLWLIEPELEKVKQPTDVEPSMWALRESQHDMFFLSSNCAFDFYMLGNSNSAESFINPVEWMIDAIGIEEVFSSRLHAIRKSAIAYFSTRKIPLERVSLITVWEYDGAGDTVWEYDGTDEVEEYLEFIGILDINMLEVV